MRVLATALFGSRARGDGALRSDTDILLVVDEPVARTVTEGTLSLSYYPRETLLRMAAAGELFVGHIVLEARVLHDRIGFFDALCSHWNPRADYLKEIVGASALAVFLASDLSASLECAVVNRRIAWCVRTILVARAQEACRPAYAAEALARFAGIESVVGLIASKDSAVPQPHSVVGLREVVSRWGSPEHGLSESAGIEQFRQFFAACGDRIGLRTISSACGACDQTEYA